MKEEKKIKLMILGIMFVFTLLIVYAFYVHRNEPHWFETKYVKIVK